MRKWFPRAVLVLILVVAAAFRLTGLDWDNYDHHHPDERYITWVATTIEWPSDFSDFVDPHKSTLNPYYWPPGANSEGIEVPADELRKFAYGHFPLYLGVAATRLVERIGPVLAKRLPASWILTSDILNGAGRIEFRHLTAVSRALTALFDLATVWVLYLLGKRLYGVPVGLTAAAFLSVDVMHVQLAHFFAFDPFVTFFVVCAIYLMVRGSTLTADHHSRPLRYLTLASIAAGLAVGSKFAAVLLLLPLAVAVYRSTINAKVRVMLGLVGVVVAVFLLSNPFVLLDMSCEVITPVVSFGPIHIPAVNLGSCFLANISTQGAMVRGDIDLPFTRQYLGTLPFVYQAEMQLRIGMGWLLGLVSFLGSAWIVCRLFKAVELRAWRSGIEAATRNLATDSLIVMSWALPFFLVTGTFYAKFMRYLQPVTPFLLLFGASWLWHWNDQRLRSIVLVLTLSFTTLFALAFVGIYDQPHPWTAASKWIFTHVSTGSVILSEQWDDALPVSMRIDGESRRKSEYGNEQLTWLTRSGASDDLAKLESNLDLMADADYLALASNRIYGVVPRLPARYPISSQYHQLLFDGSLGYEVAAVFGRFPHLFGYYLKPDSFSWPGLQPPLVVEEYLASFPGISLGRVDESFTVYDQPLTIIFKNVEHLTADEMESAFDLQ